MLKRLSNWRFAVGQLLLWGAACCSLQAVAAEPVTLQLKWLPQAQFAGYYVALAKGYYTAEGLDVKILPGGPDISPVTVISRHGADVVVSWMPDALAAREAGVPLVNIAQIYNRSGLMLTCSKASGVHSPKDFRGKTLGVWYGGSELPFMNWMAKLGLKTNSDIKLLKQGYSVEPLLKGQADCISTMSYNEYWQLVDAGLKERDLTYLVYEDTGMATLEDGLYVLEAKLADPAFVARMAKFLRASFKGWNDAVKNPGEAAHIVVAQDSAAHLNEGEQKRQMQSVAKLISNAGSKKVGYLEPQAFERTVRVLLAGGSTSVIKQEPGPMAYTHAVWEAAQR